MASKKDRSRHPDSSIQPGSATCRQQGKEQPYDQWDGLFPKRKLLSPHLVSPSGCFISVSAPLLHWIAQIPFLGTSG